MDDAKERELEHEVAVLRESVHWLASELHDRYRNEFVHGRAAVPGYSVEQWITMAIDIGTKRAK